MEPPRPRKTNTMFSVICGCCLQICRCDCRNPRNSRSEKWQWGGALERGMAEYKLYEGENEEESFNGGQEGRPTKK